MDKTGEGRASKRQIRCEDRKTDTSKRQTRCEDREAGGNGEDREESSRGDNNASDREPNRKRSQ